MDTIGNKTIKKIIPVKGNLRKNLLKKLKESKSAENGSNEVCNNNHSSKAVLKVKEPLKSPENKIIIQKIEIIKPNSKDARRISSLFSTSSEEQIQSQNLAKNSTQENVEVSSEIEETSPNRNQSIHNNNETCNSSVTLLSAKIPENSCNTSVPLKMIRTIKGPKRKPNLLHRIHRVQTTKSPEILELPPPDIFDFSSVKIEVLLPDITMREDVQETDSAAGNVLVLSKESGLNTNIEPDFCGFDHLGAVKNCDIGMWRDVLENASSKPQEDLLEDVTKLSSLKEELLEIQSKHLKLPSSASVPRKRFDIKDIKSPQRTSETNSKLAVQHPGAERGASDKSALNISLASQKYLEKLSQTENSPSKKSSTVVPPKSYNSAPTSLTTKKSSVKLKDDDNSSTNITSSDDAQIGSSSSFTKSLEVPNTSETTKDNALIPSTSKGFHSAELQPITADWMEDILTVIGTSRIEKIDESLKEIPNLITGNFSAIETENVEFKLIIKHLLRELGVESIMETVKFEQHNISHSPSMSKDDDDEDDFSQGSFDDNSNETSNFTEDSNMNEHTFEEDTCRNSSNLPSTSLSLVTSFGEIPTLSFQSESVPQEESSVAPDLQSENFQDDIDEDKPRESEKNVQSLHNDNVSDNSVGQDSSPINVEFPQIESNKQELSKPESRKRKKEETSLLAEPVSKKVRTSQRLPWNLLLDGNLRRSSLRSSSRESSAEPSKGSNCLESVSGEKRDQTIKNEAPRSSPRLSSRDSSADDTKASTPAKHSRKRLTKMTVKSEERRSSPRLSSRDSSAEPPKTSTPLLKEKLIEQRLQKLKSETDSDGEKIHRSTRMRPLRPLSDDSESDKEPQTITAKSHSSDDSDKASKSLNNRRNRKPKNIKSKKTCKLFENSSEPLTSDAKRQIELESRLAPSLDFNSTSEPSMLNVYFQSSDKRATKARTEINSMMEKLETTIVKKKEKDPSYVEPPAVEKRARLRTSAFKGTDNESECSNDEDIQESSVLNTDGPSVSSSRASSAERSNKSLNLRGRMKDLIEKEKQKLTKTSSKNSTKVDETFEKRRGRRAPELSGIAKKVFTQTPLEAAIESKVPYEEILQSIKASTIAKIGRSTIKFNKEEEVRREENLKALRALKFFRCGSCQFEVTKHKWSEHFLEHGGLAWIDGFDAPILLSDWNEAIRRTIHSFKIYNQISMKCPNCFEEKRSALGHLSHVLICGESETALEEKKIPCAHCNERFLPFTASAHKSKCSGLVTIAQQVNDSNNEGDQDSEKDETSPDSLNLSGRQKRKAGKKAEKNLKQIIKHQSEASDHLEIVSGQIKCHICGETNFVSQKEALDHIKEQHNTSLNGDFEATDSDVSIKSEEESDTEGSSGVESSEIESDQENEDNDDKLVSSKKARMSTTESQEVKNGRALISEYVDTIRSKDVTSKTIQWTKEFIDENWKVEALPQHAPRLLSLHSQDPKVILPSFEFNLKSMLFGTQQVDSYNPNFGAEFKKEWKQLEIGEHDTTKQSTTIYCGGSVSAVDWAPSNGDLNFLAVACNSCSKGIKMDLQTTTTSCVQLHEFQNLKNDKFEGFKNSSKLCYVILIKDGPIWSIKFHPSEAPLEKRVGLLAVATADQNILIYSLPYRNDVKSIILPISPNLVCKLKRDDAFFNEKFLQQASRISWFIKSNKETILAAGYVSGTIAVWNVPEEDYDESSCLYPHHVIQAHLENITALDFKATSTSEFHLVTASLDRKIKVFLFDDFRYQEITCHYAASRVLCAGWWQHWPGFIVGFDDCFTYGSILHRQPLEFGTRNNPLLSVSSSIVDVNINDWLNFVMFVSDSGDVFGCQPGQMLQTHPKDKWTYYNFSMYSSTDFNKITKNGDEEIGIVFSDFKTSTRQPKNFRIASVDRINELFINQVCFNRNEKSYRFFALGYETGFVRIRYLKNSK